MDPEGGDGGEKGALVDAAELGREVRQERGEALPNGSGLAKGRKMLV